MQPGLKKEEHRFIVDMRATLDSRDEVAGQGFHVIGVEEFLHPERDQLRCRFWLGTNREISATYTFTLTSELSVSENLAKLEHFAREQSAVATQLPE